MNGNWSGVKLKGRINREYFDCLLSFWVDGVEEIGFLGQRRVWSERRGSAGGI